ncbi:GntR family transcriptional regulator, partial [Marinomonas sp.]
EVFMNSLNLKPIEKDRTLRANVAELLREAIISGKIPPKTKLVETQLSEALKVSRGPLREAIRQLVDQGLIESIPYTGTYVVGITVKDIQELYSFRTEIERFAFTLAWEKRTDRFRDDLIMQKDRLTKAINSGDAAGTIYEELELHNVVYSYCGHDLLKDSWQRIRGRLHLYFTLHQKAHNRSGPSLTAHDEYVRLACGDDLDAMLEHVSSHMRQGYEKVEGYVSTINKNL